MIELEKFLERTNNGSIQLPDFQRGYKWDEERVRQLLITVLRGHPMGVVMLLETGNDQIRFKPRPVEGDGISRGNETTIPVTRRTTATHFSDTGAVG